MATTITTVRVIQYSPEYNMDHADVAAAMKRFPPESVLVTNDGVSTTNADRKPVTAEGGGVLMVVDNSDGTFFSHCPHDYLLVMGVRQPSTHDWYTGDASVRGFQVEPTSGWLTDEDQQNYVLASLRETGEEFGHPVWRGPIAHRLHNWSTYQPFTNKRIFTFGLQLEPGIEKDNLIEAARTISEWPANETRYFGDFTGGPLISHTTKRRVNPKTGADVVTVTTDTGLRRSLQAVGVVAFADMANLFDHLTKQVAADGAKWERETLEALVAAAPYLSGARTVAEAVAAVKKDDPAFAIKDSPAANALGRAKRGFNPLASAKALGTTDDGKVPVYLLADSTLEEEDRTTKEPLQKRSRRVKAGESVKTAVRGHVLLNMQTRWADIKKIF